MNRILCAIVLMLVSFGPHAEGEVFRSVDEHGNVHYSDKPGEGAEKLDLGTGTSTYRAQPYRKAGPDSQPAPTPPAAETSYVTTIVQPTQDESIRSNDGSVEVLLSITPELRSDRGHKIELWLDEKLTAYTTTGLSYTLQNVPRGTHTLYVRVTGHDDRILSYLNSVTFHLQRHSVLFKKP